MSFFWPSNRDPAPGLLGRLGRVLHWIGLLLAVPWAIAGAVIYFEDTDPWAAAGIASIGLVFALGGRGLRYILGNE